MLHRTDETDVSHVPGKVREQTRDAQAGLPVTLKLKGGGINVGQPNSRLPGNLHLLLDALRHILSRELPEHGLLIERIHLAQAAAMMNEDDIFDRTGKG